MNAVALRNELLNTVHVILLFQPVNQVQTVVEHLQLLRVEVDILDL